jgi:hypothetical protein
MSTLDVVVTDAAGSKKNSATIPGNVPAARIVGALVKSLKLALADGNGTPMSYKLHHQESSRQIKDELTLVESGVNNGDTLKLIPQIIAG